MGGCILYCWGDMKLGVGGRSPLCAIGHGTCPSVTLQNTEYNNNRRALLFPNIQNTDRGIGKHCKYVITIKTE